MLRPKGSTYGTIHVYDFASTRANAAPVKRVLTASNGMSVGDSAPPVVLKRYMAQRYVCSEDRLKKVGTVDCEPCSDAKLLHCRCPAIRASELSSLGPRAPSIPGSLAGGA